MRIHMPTEPRPLSPPLAGSPVATTDGAKSLSDGYTIAVRDILLSLGMKLAGSPLQIRKNQRIIEEGRPAEHFFVVLSGMARTFRLLPDGRRQITRFVFPNEILGLSTKPIRSCSADAVTDTTLFAFSNRAVDDLFATQPAFAKKLLSLIDEERDDADASMLLLGRQTALERMASFFLLLSRRSSGMCLEPGVIQLGMSRADIADYLGLTTETVSRVASQMRGLGLIRILARDLVRLERPDELERIACGLRMNSHPGNRSGSPPCNESIPPVAGEPPMRNARGHH